MSGPYQNAFITNEKLAELDPEKLLIRFGPVAVGGRQREWTEICNRLNRLWDIEHPKTSAKAESD